MAHFIQNSLCFEGDQKEIKRLLSAIQSDDPKTYPIDFHRIIPVPRE